MTKIDFEFDSPYGVFRDALYFEDGQVPDDATIEAAKQERFDNWLTLVTPQLPTEVQE